jgi:hypothetical protein
MSSPDGDRAYAPRNLIEHAWKQVAARPWRDSIVAGIGGFIAILALASARAELCANLLIAPFGASCVLVFAIPQSPLAQPRNVIGGHLISMAAGLSVFGLLGQTPLAFALGVGLAIAAMLLTGTVHPPAGADPIVVILASASWPFLSCECWSERSASFCWERASIAGSRAGPIRSPRPPSRLRHYAGRRRNDLGFISQRRE